MIPPSTKYQIDEYIKDRMPPGGFLNAVLSNNLMEAFVRADDNNAFHMKAILTYLYNDCPSACWGSPEKVEEWLNPKEVS
jgi:hypothetical protein